MNFLKYRIGLWLAIVIVFGTFFSIYTKGFNYGIDFKGGYVLEVRTPNDPNLPELRSKLENLHIGSVSIQQLGENKKDLMIKLEKKDTEKKENGKTFEEGLQKVKDVFEPNTEYRKVETIGPKVGEELIQNTIKAVIFALLAMLIYISVRFQWRYAVSGILALLVDCIGIISLYTVFNLEFNETAIISVLITASYSINDTIIIFDRIRENMVRKSKNTVEQIINISIMETLSRTVLTVTSTFLALIAMYFFGGKVIADFSMPIIIGIALGTLSSIFMVPSFLALFGLSKPIAKVESANL